MSITSTADQPLARGRARAISTSVYRAGLTAGGVALVAVLVYAIVVRAAGVPMKAGLPGAQAAQRVTLASFALGIALATLGGTVIAALLERYARNPRRTFTAIAVSATVLSLITPLDAVGAATETRITLALGHILTASIMIPLLRRGIGPRADRECHN